MNTNSIQSVWILFGSGIAVVGSFLYWYWVVHQSRDQHQTYTIKILQRWRSKEIREARELVEAVDFVGLDSERIYALVNADKELNLAVHMVLWELDSICVALDVGIVDDEQILKAIEKTMKDIWTKFKPYILHVRELGEPERYENLGKFVEMNAE